MKYTQPRKNLVDSFTYLLRTVGRVNIGGENFSDLAETKTCNKL